MSAGHDIQWLLVTDGAFRRFPFSELHETGKVLESEVNRWIELRENNTKLTAELVFLILQTSGLPGKP